MKNMVYSTEDCRLDLLDQIIMKNLLSYNKKIKRMDLNFLIARTYENIEEECPDIVEWLKINELDKIDIPGNRNITNHLTELVNYNLVKVEGQGRATTYRAEEIAQDLFGSFLELTPLEKAVHIPINYKIKKKEQNKIQDKEALLKLQKYTFSDFPTPIIDPHTGKCDVLFIGAHSPYEINLIIEKENEEIRLFDTGNITDYNYIPVLSFNLSKISAQIRNDKGIEDDSDYVMMKSDIEVDEELLGKHNIVCMGGGNVNNITLKIMEDFKDALPIRFRRPEDHEKLYSEFSKKYWEYHHNSDYALLAMLPNIYSEDIDENGKPNKVIILCVGLEIHGTQTSILALSQFNTQEKVLRNNKMNSDYPFKVVRGLIKERNVETPVGIKGTTWEIVDFSYEE